MMKSLILAISLLACAGSAALAQDQPPPQGGRAAFQQACGADLQTYCASAQSRDDRHACVQANKDKFSDSCKTFMASHPMHEHNHGQTPG
jgi:hypothetical protein